MTSAQDLAFASISELGQALRDRSVTSRSLTELFLDRLTRLGPPLNAVVTLTTDRALREADMADRELASGIDRGPLHGIPYGVKDLLATSDYPTTWGAVPFRQQQFDHDADVIQSLQSAGAVLVAKLAMVELAGGFGYEQPNASVTGPGRNAWNPDRWTGGSSSGSGAAVAAGLVPFAIGTETWGSIHRPSAYNGITGLRPTFGRVSRGGAMTLSWTLDKIGPMTHSAVDAALVLAAISGPSTADRTTIGQPARATEARTSGFRFGLLVDSIEQASPFVAANARAAVDTLRTIGTVTDVVLPAGPWDDAASMIIMCEAASAFEDLLASGRTFELTAPEVHSGVYHAQEIPALDYLRAIRIRAQGAEVMARLLTEYDALIAPAFPVVAPMAVGPFEEHYAKYKAPGFGGIGNLLGLPSIAVPTGFDDGCLPTSLEILGTWWSESTVLAIASAYQDATDWHLRRPPEWS